MLNIIKRRGKQLLRIAPICIALLLAGCHDRANHHGSNQGGNQAVVPLPAPATQLSTSNTHWPWLLLAVAPGLILWALMVGIHIGVTGVKEALREDQE